MFTFHTSKQDGHQIWLSFFISLFIGSCFYVQNFIKHSYISFSYATAGIYKFITLCSYLSLNMVVLYLHIVIPERQTGNSNRDLELSWCGWSVCESLFWLQMGKGLNSAIVTAISCIELLGWRGVRAEWRWPRRPCTKLVQICLGLWSSSAFSHSVDPKLFFHFFHTHSPQPVEEEKCWSAFLSVCRIPDRILLCILRLYFGTIVVCLHH